MGLPRKNCVCLSMTVSHVGEVPFAALGALVPDNLTRASGTPHQVVAVGVAVVTWGLGLVEVATTCNVGSYRVGPSFLVVTLAARDDPAEAAIFPSETAFCWHVLGAVDASPIKAADLRPVGWERCGSCHVDKYTDMGSPCKLKQKISATRQVTRQKLQPFLRLLEYETQQSPKFRAGRQRLFLLLTESRERINRLANLSVSDNQP